jgi:hypothetical protein
MRVPISLVALFLISQCMLVRSGTHASHNELSFDAAAVHSEAHCVRLQGAAALPLLCVEG